MESRIAMTTISTGTDVPTIVRISRAKMSCGIAIRMSFARLIACSVQPPSVAARKPATQPTRKASSVVMKAMPMVLRAP